MVWCCWNCGNSGICDHVCCTIRNVELPLTQSVFSVSPSLYPVQTQVYFTMCERSCNHRYSLQFASFVLKNKPQRRRPRKWIQVNSVPAVWSGLLVRYVCMQTVPLHCVAPWPQAVSRLECAGGAVTAAAHSWRGTLPSARWRDSICCAVNYQLPCTN